MDNQMTFGYITDGGGNCSSSNYSIFCDEWIIENSDFNNDSNVIPTQEGISDGKIAQFVFLGIVLGSLSLLTAIGNALVLYAVATERKLQTVSNMFIVSLALADLAVGVCVMPISATYIFTEKWLMGVFVCQLWIAIDYIASTASILNLFILSVDRYWSVTSPLKYIRRRTKKRAFLMISSAWLASTLWIIPVVGWHHFTNGGVRTVPADTCDTEYATNKILKIITSIFNFFLPLSVMYFLYGRIFNEIRKRSQFELGQRIVGTPTSTKNRPSSDGDDKNDETFSSESSPFPQRKHDCEKPNGKLAGMRNGNNNSISLKSPKIKLKTAKVSVIKENEAESEICDQRKNKSSSRKSLDKLAGDDDTDDGTLLQVPSCSGSLVASATTREPPSINKRKIRTQNSRQNAKRAYPSVRTSRPKESKLRKYLSSRLSLKVKKFQSSSLKKEIKAARQLGVIMGAFTMCFLPYFILFTVVAFCDHCVPVDLLTAMTWVGYLNSTLNPFLYPLCNMTFRRKFQKMLCKHKLGSRAEESMYYTAASYNRRFNNSRSRLTPGGSRRSELDSPCFPLKNKSPGVVV